MSNNLEGVHPGSICLKKTMKEFLTKTSTPVYLPMFTDLYFPELFTDQYILIYSGYYSGLTNKKSILNCDIPKLAEYIKSKYIPGTKIIFDNLHEGGVDIVVDQIHQVVKLLDISPTEYYYLTGALNASEIYEAMCIRLDESVRINIGVASVWDNAIKSSPIIGTPEYSIKQKSKIAVCFNRVTRLHRLVLTCMLINADLIDKFYYSFFLNYSHGTSNWLYENMIAGYKYDLDNADWFDNIVSICDANKSMFPLRLNIDSTYNKNFLDNDDVKYFEDSYLSLVTETFFFDCSRPNQRIRNEDTIFLSEKTFKPIAMKHPFIIASRPKTLEYIRKMGYKTFSPLIDELYDLVDDDYARIKMIVEEFKRLSQNTPEQWIEWQKNVKEIVEHNYNIFINTKTTDNTEIYYATN